MCRVMILKGIEDSTMALDFMKAVAPVMSVYNTDGIGYSAINSRNEMFTERWHVNDQFLKTDVVIDEATQQELETVLQPFKSRLPSLNIPKVNYNSIGDITREDLRTVTMHTRFATCGKEFTNTHPFVDNGMSLIHNGVISNSHILGLNKISTCDSENALQLFNNQKLNLKSELTDFQSFTDQLKGYWAFAFLSKDSDGAYMLDIVREGASLFWTEIPEMGEDCIVFATTKEIIESGIKSLQLPERKKIWLLSESNYHRFNAVNGEFIFNHEISESKLNKPFYPTYNSGYQSSKRYEYTYSTRQLEEIQPKEEVKVETAHEGFRSNTETIREAKELKESTQGVSDEIDFHSFFDTETLLFDRLYDYDKLMGTAYADTYEDIPTTIRMFIERKEEEDYIIFDDVLLMIEKYQETDEVKDIFEVFRIKKRA